MQTRNKGGLFWLLSCMTQLTDGVSHYLNLWWPPSIRLNGITRLEWQYHCLCQSTGLIVGLHPANERQHYFITTSLIGWAQAYNQPWSSLLYLPFSFWGVSYHRYVIWHSHWSPILDRRSARGTNIMHKVREVAKSWWYSEQVPVTALHKLVDRDVTIHFGYNTIRIAIHGLRYSCDMIHFPWPQHWEWDSQWQPGVRRPVIRSTAHSWLVLPGNLTDDIESDVISSMFLCCKCEMYCCLHESFTGYWYVQRIIVYCYLKKMYRDE